MMFALNPYFERTLFSDPFFFEAEEHFTRPLSFKTDIKDTGKAIVIEAELPGFQKDDVEITLQEDLLTITAKKSETKKEEEDRFLRKERYSNAYERRFTLSEIDKDGITATLENGLLSLMLPKKEKKEEQARKILIA